MQREIYCAYQLVYLGDYRPRNIAYTRFTLQRAR